MAFTPTSQEMASLDEQLGLLLNVRIAFVVLVLLGALFAPDSVGIDIGQVWPLCAGAMFVAGLAETWRRSGWPGGSVVHRALVPADGLFLTVVVAAAGGPRSPFIALFAVQIVSVLLLAGTVSGVANALWDTLLFVLLPTARITEWVAGRLGVHDVSAPGVAATVPAMAGFWVIALFTAVFTGVSQRELRRSKAEMAVLLAERARMAAMDGLTGLANRREFDDALVREVSRSRRSGEPLSLVVFDVDHFKEINDTKGHLAGDEVLRVLAQVLQGSVREMDLVARYGGEEFAVILPRCDQSDAVHVVDRITASVRRHPELDGATVSSGVATMPFNAGEGRALVAAADEALYRSKRAGRDRYSVSDRRAAVLAEAPPGR